MGLRKRASEYGTSMGAENLTVSTSALGLTVPTGAVSALITVGAEPVRFRTDGGDPSATLGHYAAGLASIEVFLQDLQNFKIIRDTSAGGDSVCFITYFKE